MMPQTIAPNRYHEVLIDGADVVNERELAQYAIRTSTKKVDLYTPDLSGMVYVKTQISPDRISWAKLCSNHNEVQGRVSRAIESDKARVAALMATMPEVPSSYLPSERRKLKVGDSCFETGRAKELTVVAVSADGGHYAVTTKDDFSLADFEANLPSRKEYAVNSWMRYFTSAGGKDLEHVQRPTYLALDYFKMTLPGYLMMLQLSTVIDSQSYQRGYAWPMEAKVHLLENLIRGRDVGKFVVVEHPTKNEIEIIDGKQRSQALMAYVGGHFPVFGVYYDELTQQARRIFNSQMLNVAMLGKQTLTKENLMEIFLDVNDTGVPQDPAHLAKVRADLEAAREAQLAPSNAT